jgi:hypothetical protein
VEIKGGLRQGGKNKKKRERNIKKGGCDEIFIRLKNVILKTHLVLVGSTQKRGKPFHVGVPWCRSFVGVQGCLCGKKREERNVLEEVGSRKEFRFS